MFERKEITGFYKMYQLLIFDWDGTLMDSQARIVACLQDAARDTGIEVPSASAARDIIGLGLREAMQSLFPAANDSQHDMLVERYREHFLVLNQSRSELFPGVETVLRELLENNYRLAVATGKSRRGLDRELEETGLGSYFLSTRCADEAFSKPHPQMLHDILDELGMDAQASLVIGDTEYDMQMAKNAGAAALGVSYGVHETERLLAHGAESCIDEFEQLMQWLHNQQ